MNIGYISLIREYFLTFIIIVLLRSIAVVGVVTLLATFGFLFYEFLCRLTKCSFKWEILGLIKVTWRGDNLQQNGIVKIESLRPAKFFVQPFYILEDESRLKLTNNQVLEIHYYKSE